MSARILVIEDNVANMDLMAYLLEASGYVTLRAIDGEEGLRLAETAQPDLVLCDIQMPKLNGYEVARALKAHAQLRSVPLIAVTAFAMVGDREKSIAAGFDGHLTKPIEPTTFVAQVESYLALKLRGNAPAPPADEGAPGNSVPPPAGQAILVVDNDPTNLQLAASVLGYAGYAVVTMSDPHQAIALARQSRPALIISDVCMPGISDGFAFVKALKADPDLQHIPFVFVTSTLTDERSRQEGLALGAREYLFRPLEAQELLDAVDKVLKDHERGRH